MNKLNVISSQSEPREEEDIWGEDEDIWGEDEDIWGEILHDESGKTVLKSISRNDNPNDGIKLETINFEDIYYENERNIKHKRIVFIRPKENETRNIVDEGAFTPGLGSWESSNPSEKQDRFDEKSCKGLRQNWFTSNHIEPVKQEQESFTLGPSSSSSNEATHQNRFDATGSKALRQNWFTGRSSEPVKPVEQDLESCSSDSPVQITPQESFAKKIRNVFRPKVLAVSPWSRAVTETPVLELDSIYGKIKQNEEDIPKQLCRKRVCKIFGAKAEKYLVSDEVESTTCEGTDIENKLVDDGDDAVHNNYVETGGGKWSKLKFWKTGFFSSEKQASPENIGEINDGECAINRSNRKARVSDYYHMVQQGRKKENS